VGAVWMGFDPEDKDHLMRQGSSLTAQMFSKVLAEGLKGVKSSDFVRPGGAVEEAPEEETTPPLQLEAVMTMDSSNQLQVLLSWIGGSPDYKYDIYRIKPNDERELIAEDYTDSVYIDTLDRPLEYRYQVVPRNPEGKEETPSNIAPINTKQLENLINDGQNHHDDGDNPEGIPGDSGNGDSGQLPPDTGNGDQTNGQNPDGQGQGNNGNNGNPGNPGNTGNPGENVVPPDIGNQPGGQPGSSSGGIELPPPPSDGDGQQSNPEGTNG